MAGKRATAKAAEAFDKVVDFLESFEGLAVSKLNCNSRLFD